MKALSGKELGRILLKHGWLLMRVHGSHHIYGRPGSIVRLSVPVHRNRSLKRGLLRHIARTAGLKQADLG